MKQDTHDTTKFLRKLSSLNTSRISQLSGLTAKSFEQLLLAAIILLKSNWMTGMEIRGSAYHHLILRW